MHPSYNDSALRSTLAWIGVVMGLTAPAHAEPRPSEQIGLPSWYQPQLSQTSEAWANVAGGRRRAFTYSGLLTFGATVDLGSSGASLGATGLGLQGGNLSPEAVGDAGIVSNIAGVSTVRLFQAWYRQALFDDTFETRVGILAIDDDFMVLDSALLFLNSGFGTAQTLALNSPAPIYPLGALGAHAHLQAGDAWEVQLGVYDQDAGDPTRARHVSHLALTRGAGAIAFGEVTFRDGPLRVAAGGFGVTGAPTREDAPAGMGSGYLMLEHSLTRLGESDVRAFAHAAIAGPHGQVVADAYADAGLVVDGAAWSRTDDTVGLAAAWTRFAPSYVRARRRGGALASTGETVVEVTYRAVVRPWLALQPDLQWVGGPQRARDDAVVVALHVTVQP